MQRRAFIGTLLSSLIPFKPTPLAPHPTYGRYVSHLCHNNQEERIEEINRSINCDLKIITEKYTIGYMAYGDGCNALVCSRANGMSPDQIMALLPDFKDPLNELKGLQQIELFGQKLRMYYIRRHKLAA
jgi:hypothetical protein